MGETLTATRDSDDKKKKKKAKKAAAATVGEVKTKAKTKDKAKAKAKKDGKSAKADRKAEGQSKKHEALDGLARLVDHPLVADLLAAGAIAAVAAIAEHKMGQGESSSKMVKAVGKAAATAMGRRLMGDLGAVATAATDAAKKA